MTIKERFVMELPHLCGSLEVLAQRPILHFRADDGIMRPATAEDVHNALIEEQRQPREVVDRHKDKLAALLINIPPAYQQKFGNLMLGAALNFLTDEEFDELLNAARVTLAADGMLN